MSTIPVDRHLRFLIESGWSVRRLAQRLGVPERTMRHWVQADAALPLEVVERLVRVLHLEASKLQIAAGKLQQQISAHA